MKTKKKIYSYLSVLLLGLLFTVASCSKSSTNDPAPAPTPSTPDIPESSATHKGVIVGSTGYFYLKLKKDSTGTYKDSTKLFVMMDSNKVDIPFTSFSAKGTDTTIMFEKGFNLMKFRFSPSSQMVESVALEGHKKIAAYVVKYDHTKPNDKKVLVLEGVNTEYVYIDKDTTREERVVDFKKWDEDKKLTLIKSTYNVVVEGGAGSKMHIMKKFDLNDTTSYQAVFEKREGVRFPYYNIGYADSIMKVTYEISNRTDTTLEVIVMHGKKISFSVEVDKKKEGKLVLKHYNTTGRIRNFVATTSHKKKLKPFHMSYKDSLGSHYYKVDTTAYNLYARRIKIGGGVSAIKKYLDDQLKATPKKAERVTRAEAESEENDYHYFMGFMRDKMELYER